MSQGLESHKADWNVWTLRGIACPRLQFGRVKVAMMRHLQQWGGNLNSG